MGAAEARKLTEESPYDVADEDDKYVTRGHSSAIRYNRPIEHDTLDDVMSPKGTLIQRRRSSTKSNPGNGMASKAFATPPVATPARSRSLLTQKRYPVMAILLGMLVMSLLAIGLT